MDTARQLLEVLERMIDERILKILKTKEELEFLPEKLRPRDFATMEYAMARNGRIETHEWEKILQTWHGRNFSFARTQSSLSMSLTRLESVEAIEEIGTGVGGSRIFEITPIGRIYLDRGIKKLHSQKPSPNSHAPWSSEDDLRLRENVKPYRNGVYEEIPNSEIVQWARDLGRSKNAIRARIRMKIDGEKK